MTTYEEHMEYRRRERNKKNAVRSAKWRKENREEFLESARNTNYKRNYGITLDEYNAMLVEQGGRCAIPTCRTDTPGGLHGKFHVDHCHITGKVRRLLCARCNATVSNHSPEHLRALADYIEQHMENSNASYQLHSSPDLPGIYAIRVIR